MPVLPLSPTHQIASTPSAPWHGNEFRRLHVQTLPFSSSPPIYLLAFPHTTKSYPLRSNHIGMSATICPHWWCSGVWFSNCGPQLPSLGGPGCLTFCPPGRHWDESTRSDLCVLARHVGQHCQRPSAVRTVRWHSTLPAAFTRLPTTDAGIPIPTCRGWLLSLSRSTLIDIPAGFPCLSLQWTKATHGRYWRACVSGLAHSGSLKKYPLTEDNHWPQTSYLTTWGVRQRLSIYFAQSSGRAELGVKVAKRALIDGLDTGGRLNIDKVITALRQYRNTPLQELGHSPAQLLYGRVLRDHQHHLIRPKWLYMAHDREVDLANEMSEILKPTMLWEPLVHWPPCILVTSSQSKTKPASIPNAG